MMTLEKEFYTRKELAGLLKISERTVQRLVESGDLRAHHIGAGGSKRPSVRFRKEDIEAYLAKASK